MRDTQSITRVNAKEPDSLNLLN